MDEQELPGAYERADQQRAMALKHAFDILDLFAFPSLDNIEMKHYRSIKRTLFETYNPEKAEWLKIMYDEHLQKKLPAATENYQNKKSDEE